MVVMFLPSQVPQLNMFHIYTAHNPTLHSQSADSTDYLSTSSLALFAALGCVLAAGPPPP